MSGKLCAEPVNDFGVCLGEVFSFANVVLEVVELFASVFVVANEFEIAFANDARWFATLVAVVWIVPEKRALGLLSLEGLD